MLSMCFTVPEIEVFLFIITYQYTSLLNIHVLERRYFAIFYYVCVRGGGCTRAFVCVYTQNIKKKKIATKNRKIHELDWVLKHKPTDLVSFEILDGQIRWLTFTNCLYLNKYI